MLQSVFRMSSASCRILAQTSSGHIYGRICLPALFDRAKESIGGIGWLGANGQTDASRLKDCWGCGLGWRRKDIRQTKRHHRRRRRDGPARLCVLLRKINRRDDSPVRRLTGVFVQACFRRCRGRRLAGAWAPSILACRSLGCGNVQGLFSYRSSRPHCVSLSFPCLWLAKMGIVLFRSLLR